MDENQPKEKDPKSLFFLIRGDQINDLLNYFSEKPYREVFRTVDILRSLQPVNLKTQPEEDK